MYQKFIILDTNILVSWLIQSKPASIRLVRSLVSSYKLAICETGYKELYRTAYKIYLKDKKLKLGEWEEISSRIEKAINSNLFSFFIPINFIPLKNNLNDVKYYQLRKQDYNDLFFLDLAVFTSSVYFITRDLKLLDSIGASEYTSVEFYKTTVIHQTHIMQQLKL